jgi:putative hydrolase of the HAD superfamily
MVGVAPSDRGEAATVLGLTRNSHHWRFPIADTRVALDRLAAAGIPMGVVSNAQGQIEAMLRRHTCQVGPGDHVEMRVIVDSEVVGVAKPDPRIFDHALPAFEGLDPARIAYVGDSVTMDVAAAASAGLHPILIDPFDDHAGADFERVRAVTDLADELC